MIAVWHGTLSSGFSASVKYLNPFYQANAPFTLQAVSPAVRSFLSGQTAPRWPHLIQVVHNTGGQPLIEDGFLTVNNSRMTVLQTLVTEKQSPLTSTHLR